MTFTGSTDTGIFNYDVIANLGPNLVFDPKLPGAYEAYYFVNGSTKKEIRPVNIIKHVGSSNVYHFIFANNPEMSVSTIQLIINAVTNFNKTFTLFRSIIPQQLTFRYSVQIGGALVQDLRVINIPIANKLNIRKSVVSSSSSPVIITVLKNILTK